MNSEKKLKSHDLVLVGAGHANLLVIKRFITKPLSRVRLIVISPYSETTYSGMLPGVIARQYPNKKCQIDIANLVKRAEGWFIRAKLESIDPGKSSLILKRSPELGGGVLPDLVYDTCILNTGGGEPPMLPGYHSSVFSVKPTSRFLSSLDSIDNYVNRKRSLSIIGAGAAGIELAFAFRKRYGIHVKISLVSRSRLSLNPILSIAAKKVRLSLKKMNIHFYEEQTAVSINTESIILDSGLEITSGVVITAFPSCPPKWLEHSLLPTDEKGFLSVGRHLTVANYHNLFGAGDLISMFNSPRSQSGVMAVRQGQYLAKYLHKIVKKQKITGFYPKNKWLLLINRCDGSAIGMRGRFVFSGKWVWLLKDFIDNLFRDKFIFVRPKLDYREIMQCEGCGAKIDGLNLTEVLGKDDFEDAFIFKETESLETRVITIDALTNLVDDPHLMGRLVVRHSISDIWAMGATPKMAVVKIGLNRAKPKLMRREFLQIQSGIKDALKEFDCDLVGGHTLSLKQSCVSVTVTGVTGKAPIPKKSKSLRNIFIISGPLGSGILFAGLAQNYEVGRWIDKCLTSQVISLKKVAQLARFHNVYAMTDVTGFGLAGHLSEMLDGEQLNSFVWADPLPVFEGVRELISLGVESSAALGNRAFVNRNSLGRLSRSCDPVIFDPQTAGPLLMAVNQKNVNSLVKDLQKNHFLGHIVGYC